MRTNKKQTGEEKMKNTNQLAKYIKNHLNLNTCTIDRLEASRIIRGKLNSYMEKFSDDDMTLDESLVEMTRFLLDILETKKEGVA